MGRQETGIGLRQGQVRLSEPTALWSKLFEQEAKVLQPALLRFDGVLEHCGSTSIPGIPAKPILDMLIGAPEPFDLEAIRSSLGDVGYEHATWAGVPGHEVFGKGNPRTHLIHVVPHGGPAWKRMLQFRNALRVDHSLAAEYAALKRSLAVLHPGDRASYTDGKSDFVLKVLSLG